MTGSAPREARLELDVGLRRPLPRLEAEALVALLMGRKLGTDHPHRLFRDPEASLLLTGESLDHATRGSRVLHDMALPRLEVSASLPPRRLLLEAGIDWLGGLLQAEPGDVLGFLVPPGTHRHDMRLLVWDGARMRPLDRLPETLLTEAAALPAFQQAAALPDPSAPERELLPAMRRVALAQLERRALPVSQTVLAGGFLGAGHFRLWLAAAASRLHGFTTSVPPRLLQAA
ncbi:hypothetical protein ACFOD4_13680 [Pseudoroseomonas globiformis]|uniref:Uncharacterized protein n=1 Tax=Teichococcus globiformis TaxID=2307229 RepID=A0ABV7G3I4_9PROT